MNARLRPLLVSSLWIFLVLLMLPTRAVADDPFTGPRSERRLPKERTVDIQHMKVSLTIHHSEGRIRGKAEITLVPLRDSLAEVALDCAELLVKKVSRPDGKPYKFRQAGERLMIECDPPLGGDSPVTITIQYEGHPKRGLYFVGPDDGYPNKPRQIYSQGEPEDTRFWIPCHDYPNDRTTSELIVTVKRPYIAISNGRLVEVVDDSASGSRTFHWKEDVAHVSYLISLVVGEFNEIKEQAGDVMLSYYVSREDTEKAATSFSRTPEMMKFFAERIGLPYPYEKYSQVTVHDFMWGGMENISATTLTHRTLHTKRSRPIANSDGLVAHELAHQWWGDLLTCRSWPHIWLNEGFATYFTSLWFEDTDGVDEFRYRVLGHHRSYQGEDRDEYRRPIVQDVYIDPMNLFDSHTYQKGASVLHMLRFVLGEKGFWRGIRQYAKKHQVGVVETEDFRRSMEDATGRDLSTFFRQWVYQAGHPKFRVTWDWDPKMKMVELRVTQVHRVDALTPLFETPVGIELTMKAETKSFRVSIRDRDQVYYLPAETRPQMVRFDPGGWILKELEFKKGRDEILFQLEFDSDVIGRIEAIRMLEETSPFPEGFDALGKRIVTDSFWGVRVEAAGALGTWGGRAAFTHLARAAGDDDARVRRAAVQALGKLRSEPALRIVRSVFAGDSNDYVEAAAAETLGEFHGKGVEKELIAGLDRPSHVEVLRTGIVRALGKLHQEDLIPTLLLETKYGRPPRSREAAIKALGEFAGKDPKVRERLVTLLRDPYIWARRAAADALGAAGDPDSLEDLRGLLAREPDARVRERARLAIRKLEGRMPQELDRQEERIQRVEEEREELRARLAALEEELARHVRRRRELEVELREQKERIRALEEAPAAPALK